MSGISRWVVLALAVAFCVALTAAAPGGSRQLLQLQEAAALQDQPELSPEAAAAAESDEAPLDREKRKILELKLGAGFGVKHFLLDLIFGRGKAKPRPRPVTTTTTVAPPRSTTADEVPVFPRTRVSLQLPDELFSGSVTLIGGVSKILGSVVQNLADRKQQLVEAAKPYVAAKLRLDINASVSTTEPIELLVPRLGPAMGGDSPSSSSAAPTADGDDAANRIERSG